MVYKNLIFVMFLPQTCDGFAPILCFFAPTVIQFTQIQMLKKNFNISIICEVNMTVNYITINNFASYNLVCKNATLVLKYNIVCCFYPKYITFLPPALCICGGVNTASNYITTRAPVTARPRKMPAPEKWQPS